MDDVTKIVDETKISISEQLQLCGYLKDAITSKIEEVTTNYSKSNQELLAEILNNITGSGIHTPESVSARFSSINMTDNLDVFSIGNDELHKKIKENAEAYDKEKDKIKKQIIGMFKLKAKAYNANKDLLDMLEAELISRNKRATKLNEEIANGQKNLEIATAELNQKEQQLEEAVREKADLDKQIADLESSLADASEKDRERISDEIGILSKKRAILDADIKKLIVSKNEAEIKANTINDKHIADQQNLNELTSQNEKDKAAVDIAKEGNEKLKQEIEQDREEFAKIGFDITEKDIVDSSTKVSPTPEQKNEQKNSEQKKTESNSKVSQNGNTTPTYGQQGQPVVNTNQDKSKELPANLSPEQRAHAIKDYVLNSPNAEAKVLLATDAYADMLASSDAFSRKDKKALLGKLGKLNSPLDVGRLTSVISALEQSGISTGLNLTNIIADGKLKDFSKLAPEDIDGINNFITTINKNKDSIDDEQLAFLQNGFINNIKYSSLAASLKPKGIKDFFKSKQTKANDEQRNAKINNLCNSWSPAKTFEEPKARSFSDILADSVRDGCYPPKPRTQEQSRDRDLS